MTTTYASSADLSGRLSAAYSLPDDAADVARLLAKASELIDFACLGRVERAWNAETSPIVTASMIAIWRAGISAAVCDQVEFWLEVGEEHDVAGLTGSLQGGRVQIGKLPGYLGQRCARTLMAAGLYYAGADAF